MSDGGRRERVSHQCVQHEDGRGHASRVGPSFERRWRSAERVPQQQDALQHEQDRKEVAQRAERGEEREVIGDPHPEPQECKQHHGEARASRGAAQRRPDREQGDEQKNPLHGPHRFVIAAKDVDELFRRVGQAHHTVPVGDNVSSVLPPP